MHGGPGPSRRGEISYQEPSRQTVLLASQITVQTRSITRRIQTKFLTRLTPTICMNSMILSEDRYTNCTSRTRSLEIGVNRQRCMVPVALFLEIWSIFVSGMNFSNGDLIYEWSQYFDFSRLQWTRTKESLLGYMTLSYITDSFFICSVEWTRLPLTLRRSVRSKAMLPISHRYAYMLIKRIMYSIAK